MKSTLLLCGLLAATTAFAAPAGAFEPWEATEGGDIYKAEAPNSSMSSMTYLRSGALRGFTMTEGKYDRNLMPR